MIPFVFSLAWSSPAALVEVAAGLPKITDIQFQKGRMVVSQQNGTLSWIDPAGKPHVWTKVEVHGDVTSAVTRDLILDPKNTRRAVQRDPSRVQGRMI